MQNPLHTNLFGQDAEQDQVSAMMADPQVRLQIVANRTYLGIGGDPPADLLQFFNETDCPRPIVTGDEIAEYYIKNYYDQVAAHIAQQKQKGLA